MTKVLVREHNASEELDELRKFLNTEAQRIVVLDEENPAPTGLAEDDLPEITWYIHKGGDVPTGVFSVVITDDGNGADGANMIVMKDEFSASKLLDSVREKLDTTEPAPLLQVEGGYIDGDATSLTYKEGVAPKAADDPSGILAIWRQRLAVPEDATQPPEEEDEESVTPENDKPAVPVINMGAGW